MNKRARIIVIAAAALAVVAVAGDFSSCSGTGEGREDAPERPGVRPVLPRKGDYDRALDLLDKLLIDNAGDSDARALRDTAMRANPERMRKALAPAQAEASGQKDIAQSLDKLGQKLTDRAATAGPSGRREVSKAEAEVQRRAEADAEAARQKAEAAELARQKRNFRIR